MSKEKELKLKEYPVRSFRLSHGVMESIREAKRNNRITYDELFKKFLKNNDLV